MTDTEKLQDYIQRSGLKQEYIAKKIGLTSYGFARKRDNKSEFTASEIEQLCNLLNITSLRERSAIFFAKKVESNSTKDERKEVMQ